MAMAKAIGILLAYQLAWLKDVSPVAIWEKSRRIGASWVSALLAVLTSGVNGEMDTWYIGYNKEMAEEFVRDCGWWAKLLQGAIESTEEFIYTDADKDILAFRIKFTSGKRIVALSSRPTNLRGKQGLVIIDEAAFHGELQELVDAALALLMWGGRVRILSTHFGEDNTFNELIQDARAGKKPYTVHRTTFKDAVAQGLYKRICQVKKTPWSQEKQDRWVEEMYDQYGDASAQELDCVPANARASFLTRNMIEACMDPAIPVLRWSPPADDILDWPEDRLYLEVEDWCEQQLAPLLRDLPQGKNFLGEDFGRTGDLTVLWPAVQLQNLSLQTPFVVELRNAPFRVQEQILFYIIDRFPNFSGACMDARGNGQYLAEVARVRYGAELVDQVMLSESWYRENTPRMKAQFEDRTISAPKDAHILDDLRALKVIKGVARIPDKRGKDDSGDRHGDAAIAAAMLICAAMTLEGGESFAVSTVSRTSAQTGTSTYSNGATSAAAILQGYN